MGVNSGTVLGPITDAELRAAAVSVSTADITASGTLAAATETVNCSTVGMSTAIVDVAGGYSGLIAVELLNPIGTWLQNGATLLFGQVPFTHATSVNSVAGRFLVPCAGYSQVRARMVSYTSGSASVNISATIGAQSVMAIQAGTWNVAQKDGQTQTFRASANGIVPPTTPTDIFNILGSASKTIRITKIVISGTQTTGAVRDILLLRRSTANTGGTAVTMTAVKLDTNNVSATAVAKYYTANATLGTLVGQVEAVRAFISTTSVAVTPVVWEFGWRPPAQALVLRGVTDSISINMNSVTSAGNIYSISVEWTEE
jgi:hypothetical protein